MWNLKTVKSEILFGFYTRWQWPLVFPFVRKWRKKIVDWMEGFDKGNILGVPITDDKIKYIISARHQFPGMIMKRLVYRIKCRRRTKLFKVYAYVANALFHTWKNLAEIKPVTSSGKYVITLVDLPPSVKSSEECIASAKLYGEDKRLEIFPAVTRLEAGAFFIEHGLSWDLILERSLVTPAEMGCFASHFSLWLKCMELGEPIVVLEHDVVFVKKIPAIKFKHVCILSWRIEQDIPERLKSRRNSGTCVYPYRFIPGAGAYAVTPEGAHLLVEKARHGITHAVDSFISLAGVHIADCYPIPVRHYTYFSSIGQIRIWNKKSRYQKHL